MVGFSTAGNSTARRDEGGGGRTAGGGPVRSRRPGGGGGSPTGGEGRGCVPRDEKGPGVARGRAARHGFTEEGPSESQAPEVPRSSPWRPSPGGRGRSGLRSATGPRAGPRSVGMPGGPGGSKEDGGRVPTHQQDTQARGLSGRREGRCLGGTATPATLGPGQEGAREKRPAAGREGRTRARRRRETPTRAGVCGRPTRSGPEVWGPREGLHETGRRERGPDRQAELCGDPNVGAGSRPESGLGCGGAAYTGRNRVGR